MKRLIQYEPGQCPASLAVYGIDCNCPVNIIGNSMDISLNISVPKTPE